MWHLQVVDGSLLGGICWHAVFEVLAGVVGACAIWKGEWLFKVAFGAAKNNVSKAQKLHTMPSPKYLDCVGC